MNTVFLLLLPRENTGSEHAVLQLQCVLLHVDAKTGLGLPVYLPSCDTEGSWRAQHSHLS